LAVLRREDPGQCPVRNGTGLGFLWSAHYPELYPCHRLEEVTGVDIACTQRIIFNGRVPCWTSRAWVSCCLCIWKNFILNLKNYLDNKIYSGLVLISKLGEFIMKVQNLPLIYCIK